MSRIQLALNVGNLDAAVEFYSKLFQTPPAKVREGYANFAVADPPLKLVLIAGAGAPGTLNHVGVEVESPSEVTAAASRVAADGLASTEDNGACCYAVQEKIWVEGPDLPWEIYAVVGDAPTMQREGDVCCAPLRSGESACCG